MSILEAALEEVEAATLRSFLLTFTSRTAVGRLGAADLRASPRAADGEVGINAADAPLGGGGEGDASPSPGVD